jgi:hypothetical protein
MLRAALAVVFMFLIGIAHSLLGITGVVFVAALFVVAFFVPHVYLFVRRLLAQRKVRKQRVAKTPSPSVDSTAETSGARRAADRGGQTA